MGRTRSNLRYKPLLLLSALLFIAYVSNILLGMFAIKSGTALPHLKDVWEFLILLAAVSTGVVFVLLNEGKHPD